MMRKIRFSNIYIVTLAVILFAIGGFSEWYYLHHIVMIEEIDDKPLKYLEFLYLLFFFLGFLTLVSIYFLEKKEKKALSMANRALQIEIKERQRVENERKILIHELQEALAKVKTLSGLLPICSSCKKIRDDKGYWNQIESYIVKHSEAEFSHGICPECAKKLYPEYYKGE